MTGSRKPLSTYDQELEEPSEGKVPRDCVDIVPRRGKILPDKAGRRWEACALVQWIIIDARIVPRDVVRAYGSSEWERSCE